MKLFRRILLLNALVWGLGVLPSCIGFGQSSSFLPPEPANLSGMGWTDAFDAMHVKFSTEYAFGEWKGTDWPGLRDTYRPRIEAAQASGDTNAYKLAVREYACSFPDGHVRLLGDFAELTNAAIKGSFGLRIAPLDDGRIIASQVTSNGPAALAGIRPGMEILEWNRQPIRTVLAGIRPLWTSAWATDYRRLLLQCRHLVRGPVNSQASVRFRNPPELSVEVALTALNDDWETWTVPEPAWEPPLTWAITNGIGYIRCLALLPIENGGFTNSPDGFQNQFLTPMTAAISNFVAAGVPGMVFDLRFNHGGSDTLAALLAGCFHQTQSIYEYLTFFNRVTGLFEPDPDNPEGTLYLEPQPISFTNKVVALINDATISSGEGLAMGIQHAPQGKVIGFSSTRGSFGITGGSIILPQGLELLYPIGRSLDSNQVIQLDSRRLDGVWQGGTQPDIRVPSNLTNVLRQAAGGDVEMEVARWWIMGASRIPLDWLLQYGLPGDGTAERIDSDGDGMNNWAEYRCGTDPKDPASCLRLAATMEKNQAGEPVLVLRWPSVNGKLYRIERLANLGLNLPEVIRAQILAQPPVNQESMPLPGTAGIGFYRIGVE